MVDSFSNINATLHTIHGKILALPVKRFFRNRLLKAIDQAIICFENQNISSVQESLTVITDALQSKKLNNPYGTPNFGPLLGDLQIAQFQLLSLSSLCPQGEPGPQGIPGIEGPQGPVGEFELPFAGSANTDGPVFSITNTGGGSGIEGFSSSVEPAVRGTGGTNSVGIEGLGGGTDSTGGLFIGGPKSTPWDGIGLFAYGGEQGTSTRGGDGIVIQGADGDISGGDGITAFGGNGSFSEPLSQGGLGGIFSGGQGAQISGTGIYSQGGNEGRFGGGGAILYGGYASPGGDGGGHGLESHGGSGNPGGFGGLFYGGQGMATGTGGSVGVKSYGGIGPASSGSGVEGIGGYGEAGINGAPGGNFTGGEGGDGADGGDGVIGTGGTGSTGHMGGIGGTFHGGTGTPGAPGIESYGGDGVPGENGGPGITSRGGQGSGNLGVGVMGFGANGLSGDLGSAGGYFEGGQGVSSSFGNAGGTGVVGFGANGLPNDLGAVGGYFQGGQGASVSGRAGGIGVVSLGANALTGDLGAAGGYFQGGNSTVAGGYGIYCRAGSGGTTYAGFFEGNVFVTGSINKSALAFKIDHPDAPSSKYLNHSGVESSEMKNIYDGITVLGETGSAWVELPSWFETLNKDFRYQLTAIGLPEPNLHIARKIEANRFQIAGGHAGTEISWAVTGVRQDPYALAHPIEVEEEKPQNEQGFFLHPELYDQPLEKSISKMGMTIRRQERINKPQNTERKKAVANVRHQIKLEGDRNADLKARLKTYKEKTENLRLKKRP